MSRHANSERPAPPETRRSRRPGDGLPPAPAAADRRPANRRRDLLLLVAILLLGLAARVLYLRDNARAPDFDHPAVDALFNDYWARGLSTGNWVPPAGSPDPRIPETPYFRPPGYPYFLALVYRLTAGSYVAPRVAQIILGLLGAVAAFLIGRRWFGAAVGLLAAAGLSLYWPLLFFEGELQAPALLNCLLLWMFYLLGLWAEAPATGRRRWSSLAAAAILIGLASLVLPNVLVFVPVAALWVAWIESRHGSRRWSWVAAAAVVVAGALLAVAPATIRNWTAAHQFVPISSNGGVNLYIGNYAGATGFVVEEIPDLGAFGTCFDYPGIVRNLEKKLGRPLDYAQVSSYFAGEAARFVRRNPGQSARLLLRKLLLFWGPEEIGHNKEIHYERQNSRVLRSLPGNFPALLACGIVGFLVLALEGRRAGRRHPQPLVARRWEMTLLAGAMILALAFSYLPFFVADRYRAPIIPFLIVLAAQALCWVGAEARARRYRPAAAWGAAGAGLYAVFSLVPQGYVPDLAQWHYMRGVAYLAGERRPLAKAEFEEALRVEPRHARSHYNLGVILAHESKLDEALAHWREVVRLRPDLPESYNNIGAALVRMGRNEEAIAALQQAVRLRPEPAEFRFNLGSALVHGGRNDEGAAELRQGLSLEPAGEQAYQAHLELGRLLLSLGRPRDSLEHYRRALQLHDDPQVANNVAWLLATHPDAACRDGAEAVRLSEHACAANGWGSFPFLDTLAAAQAEVGQFSEAVATIRKAIDLARSAGNTDAVARMTERLHLYERAQPYRDPAR